MLRRACGRQCRYLVLRKYAVVNGAPPTALVDSLTWGGSGSVLKPWKPPSSTTSLLRYFRNLKPGFRHVTRHSLRANPLNGLEGLEVVPVHHVIHDDQVGVVTAANRQNPQRVHLADDVACVQVDAAVSIGGTMPDCAKTSTAERSMPPTTPVVGLESRQDLKAAHQVGHRAVTINTLAKAVHDKTVTPGAPLFSPGGWAFLPASTYSYVVREHIFPSGVGPCSLHTPSERYLTGWNAAHTVLLKPRLIVHPILQAINICRKHFEHLSTPVWVLPPCSHRTCTIQLPHWILVQCFQTSQTLYPDLRITPLLNLRQ